MAKWHGQAGRKWRALCQQVYTEETHCYWCGHYVDQTLPPTHRMSRTADHKHEVHEGGHPLDRDNVTLMHRACNSAKSNKIRARRRAIERGAVIMVDPTSI